MFQRLALVLLSVAFASACSSGSKESLSIPTATPLDTPSAKLSYCLGLDYGFRLRGFGVELDEAALFEGSKTGIDGKEPRLSQKEIQAILTEFNQGLQARAREALTKFGEKNKAAAAEFFEKNRLQEGVKQTASGLQYKILKKGDGPKAGPKDRVRVHYIGRLLNGAEFGNTRKKGEPQVFATDRIIAGWSEAMRLMPRGSTWQVFIPPQLAYGEKGQPPHIQPNSALIFEVELLDIFPPAAEANP
jgi:FKBP-type peptidyl-prolyl cis-trans isomerase